MPDHFFSDRQHLFYRITEYAEYAVCLIRFVTEYLWCKMLIYHVVANVKKMSVRHLRSSDRYVYRTLWFLFSHFTFSFVVNSKRTTVNDNDSLKTSFFDHYFHNEVPIDKSYTVIRFSDEILMIFLPFDLPVKSKQGRFSFAPNWCYFGVGIKSIWFCFTICFWSNKENTRVYIIPGQILWCLKKTL